VNIFVESCSPRPDGGKFLFVVVMDPGQIFLIWIGLGQFFVAGVGLVNYLLFGFAKFPLKMPNFKYFSLRIKINIIATVKKVTRVNDRLASYLLQVKSMLGLGL